MADRSVKVTLRAEVSDYKRQMAQAAAASDKVATAFDKNGQAIETRLGRLSRSQQVYAENWNKVAIGLGVVVAGTVALEVAALRTGIAYNTLQQTSRAALTTLLGSAEAANAQMDRLDTFARTSPFAKQVFITAQQQLLGFGVAAKDVVPTLDAIQQAVAAFGGSNDQIAAIADILARVKSEGKLSGDALERLGYYGIDAAQLIGSQMGKTSAEIRDMASKPGGIPVDQIWDPLVNGMQGKFGGAADNVKNTFVGALDRVKAAWRDLASDLVEPLVGKDGGGALVTIFNDAADLMRLFEDMPGPLKTATVATIGLVAVLGLLGIAAIKLVPAFTSTWAALTKTEAAATRAKVVLAGLSVGMGVLLGVMGLAVGIGLAFAASQRQAKQDAADLAETLDHLTGSITDGTRAKIYSNLVDSGAIDNAKELGLNIATVTDAALGNVDAQREISKELDAQAAKIRANYTEWDSSAETQDSTLQKVSLLRNAIGDQNETLDAAKVAWQDEKAAMDPATTSTEDHAKALNDLVKSLRDASGLALDESDALRGMYDATQAAADAAVQNKKGLDQSTASGRKNSQALDNLAKRAWDWVDAGEAAGASSSDLADRVDASREAFVKMAIRMGASQGEAEALADAYGLIPTNITTGVGVAGYESTAQKLVDLRNKYRALMGLPPLTGPLAAFKVTPAQGSVSFSNVTGHSSGQSSSKGGGGKSAGTSQTADWTNLWRDWQTSQRRGENLAAGTSGDGLSLVDKLLSISDDLKGTAKTKTRAQALAAEKAYLKLQKQAEKADKAVEKAADKLDTAKSALDKLKDAASQMASKVSDAVKSIFNVSDWGSSTSSRNTTSRGADGLLISTSSTVTSGPSAASIVAKSDTARASAERFAGKIKRLAAMGLSGDLLAQVASLGIEAGEPIVDALLTATASDIASINANYVATGNAADLTGKTVADTNFDALIDNAEAQVALAQKNLDAANANADKIDKRLQAETQKIIKEITAALQKGKAQGHAEGGPISGPGTGTSDSILIRASNGEHMLTAAEVNAMGGHAAVARIRAGALRGRLPGYRIGGPITFGATGPGAGLGLGGTAPIDYDQLAASIAPALMDASGHGTAEALKEARLIAQQFARQGYKG